MAKFREIERLLLQIKAGLKTIIVSKKASGDAGSNGVPRKNARNHNLPTMKLPIFNGEYDKWGPFKERFCCLLDEDVNTPTIFKYGYLLDCLSDTVKKATKMLDFVEANYGKALELLDKKCKNKRIAVDRHIAEIVNMKPLTKESSSELMRVVETMTNHGQSLQSLDVPVVSWDAILVFLTATKLDVETRKRWEETRNSKMVRHAVFVGYETFSFRID